VDTLIGVISALWIKGDELKKQFICVEVDPFCEAPFA
jgi:hypothetical protein